MMEMPRRVYTYPDLHNWERSTSLRPQVRPIMAIGVVVIIRDVVSSCVIRRRAEADAGAALAISLLIGLYTSSCRRSVRRYANTGVAPRDILADA